MARDYEAHCVWEGRYEWVTKGDLKFEEDLSSDAVGLERYKAVEGSGEYLTVRKVRRLRKYDPLIDEPSLYIELGTLDLTKEAIKEFANRYGHLMPVSNLFDLGFTEVKREIRKYQKAFRAWMDKGEGEAVFNAMRIYGVPHLLSRPIRYVLKVSNVIPSAWLQLAIAMNDGQTLARIRHRYASWSRNEPDLVKSSALMIISSCRHGLRAPIAA